MKIVISGTYSTGKTLTSIALSLLTGIPKTHAKTMRELLADYLPGKKLEKCDFHELIELGIRRFTERIIHEKRIGDSFITDGCPLQEWLYGTTRIVTGLDPSEKIWKIKTHKFFFDQEWDIFKDMIQGFGQVVKEYTKNNYNIFIHLPIEFPFVSDGHRPASELFRAESEQKLLETYKELKLPVKIVKGTVEERLVTIMAHCNIEPKISITEAIKTAYQIKKECHDSIKLESL